MTERLQIRPGLLVVSSMVVKLWLVVASIMVFQIIRRSEEQVEWSTIGIGVATFASLFFGTTWALREAYRVVVTPSGIRIGWSKPVDWKEITSVDRGRVPLAGTNYLIRSVNKPTGVILDEVAERSEFREALRNWCPRENPLHALSSHV